MTSTAVSDYSSDSVRYYHRYFQDRDADAQATDTEDDQEGDSDKKRSGEKLPRIILRNKLGKELDTFTTLQEAIYRAKRNVRESLQATQPEEWRLPNAPLPSRPDFSRAVPSITELRKRRKAKQQKTAKSFSSVPYDVDVDDVGFVAESLQHLPKVPSLSFLRHELLAEPKRYFPFVQSMLLFKKYLSETDKRDHIYNFPGFCTGCQRMGLCYGCERSLEPHYHVDQPMKTGGGFTFYKRDRPEHELKHRHPSNWRYTFPELAKRAGSYEAWKEKEGLVMDQELNYDEVRRKVFLPHLGTDDTSKITEDQGVEGETIPADKNRDNMSDEDEGILVDKITAEEEELLGIKPSKSSSPSSKRSKPSSQSTKRSKRSSPSTRISGLDGDDEMYSGDMGSEVTGERMGSEVRGDTAHTGKGKRVYIVEDLKHLDGKSSRTVDGSYTDQSTDNDDDDERGEGSQLRRSRRKRRTGRSRDTQTDEEDDDRSQDGSPSQSKSPFSRSSSEKRRLYKAPAPFKIKKRSRKVVASVSPFSSNRNYNLPKGDGFKVKKSDKSPTQIKEFKHHEGDWKAPKQFEVKKSDKKSTGFWSPPPQKEKPKPVKIKREVHKIVEHPPSPDSGLESEKMTGIRKIRKLSENESKSTHNWDNDISTSVENDKLGTIEAEVKDPRRVGQGRQTKNVESLNSSINEDISNICESQNIDPSDSSGLESKSDLASCHHSDAQIQKCSSERVNKEADDIAKISSVESDKKAEKEKVVRSVRNSKSNKQKISKERVHKNKATDVAPEPPPVTMETDQQRETTPATKTKPSSPEPQTVISTTPAKTPAPVIEKLKKEKPKKTKKEKVKDEPKPQPPTPPPPVVERSMSPDTPLPQLPSDGETEVAMATPTPEPTKEVPELPVFDIPALPEIKDEKKTKVDDRRTQLIQAVPKMKEVKEPLPKKKFTPKITKKSMPKRQRSSAKAPVTPEELKQMTDPLDFLAKYCIINKDRLPYYDRIYHNIVSNQTPKYERIHDTHASISGSSSFPVLADHEMNMLHDMTVINRAQEPVRIGLSVPEQYLEKICYTLDFLEQKQNKMSLDLHNLETEKIKKLAEKAKELIPHIVRPDFQVKASKKSSKKKKKKKGKGKEEKVESDEEAPPEKLTAADITDRVIVDRIDDKTLNSLCKQPDIHQLDLEMDRIAQKVSDIDERIEQLENEKNLLGIYCMEYFFRDQGRNKKPAEFRRQQSSLYNKLHPDPDIEMNMEELEGALQVINHSLLTEKEFEYLYNVLNLPGRLKINFQLFAVIAALSEKVTQLDPVIRKLLNKVDYGALNVKMDRSKELFELLDDGTITPSGNAPADSLAVELRAGGLSPEHTNYVLSKFNRNGNGFIDFLDFVTYVPLFIEIHEKIVKDPFNVQMFV